MAKLGKPAGALNKFVAPVVRRELDGLALTDLAAELFARLSSGDSFDADKDLVLAGQLQDVLATRLDVHLNRFSRRRLYDVARPVLDVVPLQTLQGATIVDLGSGSLNPLAFGFVFLALGARRAYSIDLEPVQDAQRAIRALADAAAWLLIDGTFVVGEHAPGPEDVLRNLHGFHLPSLQAGDEAGLAAERLIHRSESIYDLQLDDGEAELVSSVSLLEHIDRIEDAMASLQRVTRRGGVGHHVVDFIDHRVYGGEAVSPFEFLKVRSRTPLVHGCNRIRCSELCALFERFGFTVERIDPSRIEPVSADEQQTFAEPFQSMRRDDLSLLCARILVRRL